MLTAVENRTGLTYREEVSWAGNVSALSARCGRQEQKQSSADLRTSQILNLGFLKTNLVLTLGFLSPWKKYKENIKRDSW